MFNRSVLTFAVFAIALISNFSNAFAATTSFVICKAKSSAEIVVRDKCKSDESRLNAISLIGPQGPAGEQGIQGVQGIQGIQGEPGETGTVTQRLYYMTTGTFTGAQALTACSTGYHFASLFEIWDVSNLTYNTTLGYGSSDSGFGPPSGYNAWVRTGAYSAGSSNGVLGVSNCNEWTSADTNEGTYVYINQPWANAPAMGIWTAGLIQCAYSLHVMCVQDPS